MQIKTSRMKKAMFLILYAILIWWIFDNFKFVAKGFILFLGLISPFIIGLVIAFILNKPMTFTEKKLFDKGKIFGKLKDKYKRPISLSITMLLVLIVITLLFVLVIPNFILAGSELAANIPRYWENIQNYINNTSIKYSAINDLVQQVDFNKITDSFYSFVSGGFTNWFGSIFTVFTSIIGGLVSLGFGFVFAIYFLLQKETLMNGIKKLIYAVFPLNVARRICYIGTITGNSFSKFLVGQTIDVLSLGTLFLISMLIFKFPYPLMVSIIISITAFIPIVGSFIGLIIGTFLIFAENPNMAVYFVLLFLVLQQIEGNLIYPKVVGKASGLSPVWILAAVALGGGLMGIVGIILFVPLFAVIQKLLSEYIEHRLKDKDIDIDVDIVESKSK